MIIFAGIQSIPEMIKEIYEMTERTFRVNKWLILYFC